MCGRGGAVQEEADKTRRGHYSGHYAAIEKILTIENKLNSGLVSLQQLDLEHVSLPSLFTYTSIILHIKPCMCIESVYSESRARESDESALVLPPSSELPLSRRVQLLEQYSSRRDRGQLRANY